MGVDLFGLRAPSLDSPPTRGFAITPHATNELDIYTRAIMVSVAGDVAVVTVDGDTVTLPGLQVGVQYAIRAKRVLVSGTTATGIVGLA